MTEKRFRKGKSILTDFPTGAIIDEKTGERYYDGIKPSYISSEELVKVLNELYEENKELKQKVDFYKYFQKDARELEKENEILKAQLYCTFDSVCTICNNEYLEQKSVLHRNGEYYISKCKKGHKECSKTDVVCCEDFELKGDKK